MATVMECAGLTRSDVFKVLAVMPKYNLGDKVKYNGRTCIVVGKKRLDYGAGPVVYELVIANQYSIYKQKAKELKELRSNNLVSDSFIAHVPDEELRNEVLDDDTPLEVFRKLQLAPVVGFLDVPEENIEELISQRRSRFSRFSHLLN